jgi:hypothetical protein
VHWRKLIEGCDLYRQLEPRDYVYVDYMRKRGGDGLPPPDEFDESRAQDLIDFINSWATRSPMKAIELQEAYRCAHSSLSRLAVVRLESARLEETLDGDQTVADAAAEVFDIVANCGSRTESTGASKILHVLLPHFFVMWDMRIAGGYGLCREATQPRPAGREYAFTFLPRVLKELEEAIVTYAKENLRNRQEAAAALEEQGGMRPLPKLLDEFDYAKYTLSLNQLWDRV